MIENSKVGIFGDGKQCRDFVFVKDVAEANLLAVHKGDQQAFNIGTGKTTTVNELFNLLSKTSGYKKKPKYLPPRAGEVQMSCLDAGKAKKILGWQPRTDLSKGLQETYEHIKSLV
jgi:UDP-glucose 4-epimerase